MLQKIREVTGGLAAWVIIIMMSIPFALWGIQEYTGIGSQPPIATVDGHYITDRELSQQVQQARANMRNRMGKSYRPELFDQTKLRKDVLEEIIRERLIFNRSSDMGLRVSDEQVRSVITTIPTFQKDGKFDHEVYEIALSRQGRTPVQFEEQIRSSLISSQLDRVITSSEFITEQDITETIQLRNQKRSFKYFILPTAQFKTNSPILDKDIANYYATHKQEFEIPEKIKLDYLVLESSSTTTVEKPTEAQLQELYQTNIQQYKTPEKRQLRHILVTLEAKSTPEEEKAAREKINKARTRIVAGESFETIAKEISQDPGSASKGGDLGLVGKGIMVPEFEQAAFALPQGKLSDPVRSAFGLHLIEVTKIEPEYTKPFKEVQAELADIAHSEAIMRDYLRIAEQLSNLIYEHPDSLEPAAQHLNLKVQHSDWLSKTGGSGLFSNLKIIKAAFADEVLVQGNNSELIEITEDKQQKAVVVRIADHQNATFKPVGEVKEIIITALRQQQARQAALRQAETLAAKLRTGEDLIKVATGYSIEKQELIKRDTTPNDKLSKEILDQAFKLPVIKPPKISTNAIQLDNGNAVVIVLDKVQSGNITEFKEPELKDENRKLAQVQAKTYYDSVISDIRNRAEIWIAPQDEKQVILE